MKFPPPPPVVPPLNVKQISSFSVNCISSYIIIISFWVHLKQANFTEFFLKLNFDGFLLETFRSYGNPIQVLRVFHVPDQGRSLVVAVAHLPYYCDTAVNTDRLVPKHHRAVPVTKGIKIKYSIAIT